MSAVEQNAASVFDINLRAVMATLLFTGMLLATILAAPAARAQTFHVIYTFTGSQDGGLPSGAMAIDRSGALYGTTETSRTGAGTVYKLAPRGSGWILTPLYDFSGGSDGELPVAGVIFGPDGSLYGTTLAGGVLRGCPGNGYNGCGVVFQLQPPSSACKSAICPWHETVLYSFAGGTDGWNPWDGVTFDQAGNLYGTTYYGGSSNCTYGGCGIVFKLTHSGGQWTKSTLYGFASGNDGASPMGGVTFNSSGNLYGSTTEGGTGNCRSGCGTIFSLTPSNGGWAEQVIYSFQGGSDGGYPTANLISDTTGNLYSVIGANSDSDAPVFELTSSNGNWSFNSIYQVLGGGNSLVMDAADNLYGTSGDGGADGLGLVFKLTPSGGGWLYTDLHDFTGFDEDGFYPNGGVALDVNGNIYGTASQGGNLSDCYTGCGVVWEITP